MSSHNGYLGRELGSGLGQRCYVQKRFDVVISFFDDSDVDCRVFILDVVKSAFDDSRVDCRVFSFDVVKSVFDGGHVDCRVTRF